MCRYNEDTAERLSYYEKMIELLPKDISHQLEKDLFMYFAYRIL